MLIAAILLTVLGFIIMQWSVNAMSQTFKPLIFYKPVAVVIIYLLWLGLIIGGLYCFWQVSYLIVLILVSVFLLLILAGLYLGSEKTKAKKICKIYKQIKLYQPLAEEQKILQSTARVYFQNLRWDKAKIDMTLESIFKKDRISNDRDIKDLISSIFIWENPSADGFGSGFNFEQYMKKHDKTSKAIDSAYNSVFGRDIVTERPALSKEINERLVKQGFNPDEMSNEQLAALESLEKSEKYHWFPRVLNWIAGVFGFSAVISLFRLDFLILSISGGIALLLSYLAYRIQSTFAIKKFQQASIQKFVNEQRQNQDE